MNSEFAKIWLRHAPDGPLSLPSAASELPDGSVSGTDLAGPLEIQTRYGEWARIEPRLIEAVSSSKQSGKVVVRLRVESPLRGSGKGSHTAPLQIALSRSEGDDAWKATATCQWSNKPKSSSQESIGSWFTWGAVGTDEATLQLKENYQLGPTLGSVLSGAIDLDFVALALLKVPPLGVQPPKPGAGESIRLHLAVALLSHTGHLAPAFFELPLAPQESLGRASWRLLVKGDLARAQPKSGVTLGSLFQALWNPSTVSLLLGARAAESGSGWSAVPEVAVEGDSRVVVLLDFDIVEDGTPRMRQLHLCKEEAMEQPRPTVRLTFPWRTTETIPQPKAGPRRPLGSLVLETRLKELTWPGFGALGEWPRQHTDAWKWDGPFHPALASRLVQLQEDIRARDSFDPRLLELDLQVDKVAIEPPESDAPRRGVLNFGALDVAPETGDVHAKGVQVLARLRGLLAPGHVDLYPDLEVDGLPCEVRLSAVADPELSRLQASLDGLGPTEQSLESESSPMWLDKNVERSTRAKLHMRTRGEPGRDRTAELLLTSLDHFENAPSVYFQAKPFLLARVEPPDLAPETGSILAHWRSDDPEGPQWRIADSTLELDLPPQAVAEEMERGARFWNERDSTPTPYIEPDQPLRYRFSPPTRLVVRPSAYRRRYHPVPNNLVRALDGAVVESFRTEIVYPVSVRFSQDERGQPDIRIAETAHFLGRPTVHLPPVAAPRTAGEWPERERLFRAVFSEELGSWVATLSKDKADSVAWGIAGLRRRHVASRANFASRLGKYHLFDPLLAGAGLHLQRGLEFRIRDRSQGAPPLLSPLARFARKEAGEPAWEPLSVDLTDDQKREIASFLTEQKDALPQWGREEDGAVRAGVLHTIEFASELVAILRDPTSQQGLIDSLSFSTLGASGSMAVSFDEGRTTFVAECVEGQLARLVKIRIGRVGLLWNRARHVIVYERSVVPSQQFMEEQVLPGKTAHLGWPLLRKHEEYVEPIERIREFGAEPDHKVNVTAFLEASEFKTPRIYVNGAWGRDLGSGYEIPLWNAADTSGFYPKPTVGLRARAGDGPHTYLAFMDPDELVFYSSTEPGQGSETDRWPARAGVDAPLGAIRLGLITALAANESWKAVLEAPRRPGARRNGARRKRFDLRVVADGQVDLMSGRPSEPVLASLGALSLARTAESEASTSPELAQVLSNVGALQRAAERLSQPEAVIRQFESSLDAALLQFDCEKLKSGIKDCLSGPNGVATKLRTAIGDLRDSGLPSLPTAGLSAELEAALVDRLAAPLEPFRAIEVSLNDALAEGLAAWRRNEQKAARELVVQALEVLAHLEAAHESVSRTVARAGHAGKTAKAALTSLLDSGGLKGLLSELLSLVQKTSPWTPDDIRIVRGRAGEVREPLRRMECVLPPSIVRLLLATVEQIEALLGLVAHFLEAPPLLAKLQKGLTEVAEKVLASLKDALGALDGPIDSLAQQEPATALAATTQRIQRVRTALRDAAAHEDKVWEALKAAQTALQRDAGALVHSIQQELQRELATMREEVLQTVASAHKALKTHADELVDQVNAFWKEEKKLSWSEQWISGVLKDATALVESTPDPCAEIAQFQRGLRAALEKAAAEVRRAVSGALNELFDEAARAKLEELAQGTTTLGNRLGSGLKVTKAIGELAQIAPLTSNVDLAEFVFSDDPARAIEMTPCAVKFGEIAAGLKGLGLSMPSRRIFGQVLPEGVDDLGFGDIFKSLGGIRFDGLFPHFLKIPMLSPEQVKISHGLDRGSRTAWVRAGVNVEYPEPQVLFGDSTLGVRLQRMHLRAESEVRVSANGTRETRTDGSLRADWLLEFGGNRLIVFREVTLRFDGSQIQFDLDPKRVELHPAIRFVSDFAQALGKRVPPSVQIEKDDRGVPVGARVALSTVVERQNWGAITLGPLAIQGGLGLGLRNSQFSVAAHFSLGSARAPVFVQIGWLGGGLWLESAARFSNGALAYSADLGLALGAARSFDVAGIARGSFSCLLFASARFGASGGALRAGLSIEGSAQLLGIAHAYIGLLLTVEHSGGRATGYGTLDVEIEICWCYKLSVHRQVTQAL